MSLDAKELARLKGCATRRRRGAGFRTPIQESNASGEAGRAGVKEERRCDGMRGGGTSRSGCKARGDSRLISRGPARWMTS